MMAAYAGRIPHASVAMDLYKEWSHRVEVARLKNRPGDILVLAEEAPTRGLRLEAMRTAGEALAKLGQFKFALEQYEGVLKIDPADPESRRQKGILLGRVGKSALDVIDREIARSTPPWEPRKVFLFSGHMIDRPGRIPPRFPADKEALAAEAIARMLDELGAAAGDLAICGGACGGDILFAEASLARGLRLQLHIQFREPEFLKASVSFAGVRWVERFDRLKAHENTALLVMPDELGEPPQGKDPYERNNLWQLYTALSHGPEKVRFVGLWNGEGGDGPGGTRHMLASVEERCGRAYIVDTKALRQQPG